MTDTLDERIRELVTELMESAPQAPSLSELEWRDDRVPAASNRAMQRARLRRHPLALLGGLGAVVGVILLLVLLLPSAGEHQPAAAAAQLSQIAANAAGQPTPSLSDGQYLETESTVSLLATVTQVGSTPTPNAQATINGTITQWTDRFGDSCISATSSPAQFASPANQAAWKAAGVLDSPTDQPATSCVTVSESLIPSDSASQSGGIVDVSTLPTDPSVLAHELSTGTTGVAGLDQMSLPPGENAGFERAANLLVGPTAGGGPAFTSALFKALALIPDVSALGSTTTHSGANGLGFSGDSGAGKSVLVVDPATGALLEARNLQSPIVFQGLGPSYLAPPPTPSIGTEGGSYGTVIQWLDPIGTPRIVNSLPAGLSLSEPVPVAAAIKAVASLNVSYTQLEYLSTLLSQRFGGYVGYGYASPALSQPRDGATRTTTPSGPAVHTGAVVEYDLGSAAKMHQYAQAMRASGLFASITEYTAKGQGLTIPSVETASAPTTRAVVAKVTSVPQSVYDAVGALPLTPASPVTQPTRVTGQPPLHLDGTKPTVLWVGADYCPFCAANRWALVAALSRFGTWSHLKLIASSATDVAPSTNTFTFDEATYTSPYLSFVSVELNGNAPTSGDGHIPDQTLTKQEQQVVDTYETATFLPGAVAGPGTIPFIDINNSALVSGASFNPGVLAGLSWSTIADSLINPSNPVTQSIVATANDMTASICASTNGLPASVCSSPGVQAAVKALS
jgi:hypothetical protein